MRFEVPFMLAMLVQSFAMILVHFLLLKACVEAEQKNSGELNVAVNEGNRF